MQIQPVKKAVTVHTYVSFILVKKTSHFVGSLSLTVIMILIFTYTFMYIFILICFSVAANC